jgi:hypothetical protein
VRTEAIESIPRAARTVPASPVTAGPSPPARAIAMTDPPAVGPAARPTTIRRHRALPAPLAGLHALAGALAERFQLPQGEDPAQRPGRMLGICAWATALGLVGIGVALRVLVALLAGATPGWFEPTITTLGLLGIGLTAVAFAGARRRRLPWALLGAATATLALTLGASLAAL